MKIQTEQSQGYIEINSVLFKADAKHKDVVYIEASNELQDVEGDILLQKALKDEKERFLQQGVLSWDHLHKSKNDPSFIVGEPLDVAFAEKTTLVKGRIYETNKYGKGILSMVRSGTSRLGASVGGFIVKRSQQVDNLTKSVKKYITKVLWDEVAITNKPINEGTLGSVSSVPFDEFAKSFVYGDQELYENTPLFKALTAGAGGSVGGASLIKESLMGSKTGAKPKENKDLTSKMKMILRHMEKGNITNFNQLDSALIKYNLVPYRKMLMNKIIKIAGVK